MSDNRAAGPTRSQSNMRPEVPWRAAPRNAANSARPTPPRNIFCVLSRHARTFRMNNLFCQVQGHGTTSETLTLVDAVQVPMTSPEMLGKGDIRFAGQRPMRLQLEPHLVRSPPRLPSSRATCRRFGRHGSVNSRG